MANEALEFITPTVHARAQPIEPGGVHVELITGATIEAAEHVEQDFGLEAPVLLDREVAQMGETKARFESGQADEAVPDTAQISVERGRRANKPLESSISMPLPTAIRSIHPR